MSKLVMSHILLCLCILPPLALANVKVHKWEDYSKPFNVKIQRVSDNDPGIVEVDFPESILKNFEIVLIVSTSTSGPILHARVVLSVNGRQVPLFFIGSDVAVILKQGIIKPGANTLVFSTIQLAYDVNSLRFELREPSAKIPKEPAPDNLETSETQPIRTQIILPPSTGHEEVKKPEIQETKEGIFQKREEDQKSIKPDIEPSKQETPLKNKTDPGQRWAVVIGISEYEDSRIPSLRYATRDAQSIYEWLVSSNGGRYAPSRVKLLLDRNATNEKIKEALFSWLKQAIEEDMVVIYFAGHGSPESPDALGNLYLLPYNTKYNNIAVTGFPMWDIETALKRFIKAKRVVIIADACHAGGVGQAFEIAARADRGIQPNPINSGFQNLTDIGEGICVISASRDKEISREGREWGGGHGVFTYYLLEGLKGGADFDKSDAVTIGELTVYVSQQVRRATLNAQNPIVAGRFDPSLTMSK